MCTCCLLQEGRKQGRCNVCLLPVARGEKGGKLLRKEERKKGRCNVYLLPVAGGEAEPRQNVVCTCCLSQGQRDRQRKMQRVLVGCCRRRDKAKGKCNVYFLLVAGGGGDAPLAGEERQRMDNVMCISCLLQKEREREKGRCNVYLSVCLLQEERERREKMMQQVEEGELLVEK